MKNCSLYKRDLPEHEVIAFVTHKDAACVSLWLCRHCIGVMELPPRNHAVTITVRFIAPHPPKRVYDRDGRVIAEEKRIVLQHSDSKDGPWEMWMDGQVMKRYHRTVHALWDGTVDPITVPIG